MTETPKVSPEPRNIAQVTGGIINAFNVAASGERGFLTKGDLSALRRQSDLPPSAFWRLMARVHPEMRPSDEKSWECVVRGIALMMPSAHRPDISFGQVAATCGYADPEKRSVRLDRLLEADEESFERFLMSACSFMAAKGAGFNWVDFAHFVVLRGEKQKLQIARDFFRVQSA